MVTTTAKRWVSGGGVTIYIYVSVTMPLCEHLGLVNLKNLKNLKTRVRFGLVLRFLRFLRLRNLKNLKNRKSRVRFGLVLRFLRFLEGCRP